MAQKIIQPQLHDIIIDYGVFPINCIRINQGSDTVTIEKAKIDTVIKALQEAKKHFE